MLFAYAGYAHKFFFRRPSHIFGATEFIQKSLTLLRADSLDVFEFGLKIRLFVSGDDKLSQICAPRP